MMSNGLTRHRGEQPTIYVWDPVMNTPYYSAGLVKALRNDGYRAYLVGASPTYDHGLTERFGIGPPSLLCQIAARSRPDFIRKLIRFADACVAGLPAILRAFQTRAVLHVQWLPGLYSWLYPIWMVLLAALGTRCRLVLTEHNREPHNVHRVNVTLRAKALVYPRFHYILLPSWNSYEACRSTATRLSGTSLVKVSLPLSSLGNPNPRPPAEFTESQVSAIERGELLLIGHVGTGRDNKRISDLVEVGKFLDSSSVLVVIAGNGMPALGSCPRALISISRRLAADEVEWILQKLSITVLPYDSISGSAALTTSIMFGHAIVVSEAVINEGLIGENLVDSYLPGDTARLGAILMNLCSNPEQLRQKQSQIRDYASTMYQYSDLVRDSSIAYR